MSEVEFKHVEDRAVEADRIQPQHRLQHERRVHCRINCRVGADEQTEG